MRSAHSRKSLAEILSRPVALDLLSLYNNEKTLEKTLDLLILTERVHGHVDDY